jgi:hypothetical protein
MVTQLLKGRLLDWVVINKGKGQKSVPVAEAGLASRFVARQKPRTPSERFVQEAERIVQAAWLSLMDRTLPPPDKTLTWFENSIASRRGGG